MALGTILPTKFSVWPTKEDPVIYKLNSFWIELNQELTVIERATYNLLDLMGDIGGLYDGLFLLIKGIIRPIAALTLNSKLLRLVFKLVKSKGNDVDETTHPSQIPKKNFFHSIALCGRKSRYRKMTDRADFMIKKQLDLVKFVHKQRLLMLNLLTTRTIP